MEFVLLGVFLFSLVLGSVRLIQKYNKITYVAHPIIFTGIYITSIFILLLSTKQESLSYIQNDYAWFLLVIFASYLSFSYLWDRTFLLLKQFAYESVPEQHHEILVSTPRYVVVKFCEILFQDIAALVLVVGLYNLGFSTFTMSLIFAGFVFVLHIGTPFIFGKFYGGYFLLSGTLIAFFIPTLLLEIEGGFYALVSIHVLSYVVILLGGRYLGRNT